MINPLTLFLGALGISALSSCWKDEAKDFTIPHDVPPPDAGVDSGSTDSGGDSEVKKNPRKTYEELKKIQDECLRPEVHSQYQAPAKTLYFPLNVVAVRSANKPGYPRGTWETDLKRSNDFYRPLGLQFFDGNFSRVRDAELYGFFLSPDTLQANLAALHSKWIAPTFSADSVLFNAIPIYLVPQAVPSEANYYGYASIGEGVLLTLDAEGPTLSHELGHFFGLYHPFDDNKDEAADGSQCRQMGDFLCDTPPDIKGLDALHMPCQTDSNCEIISCPSDDMGVTYQPDTKNIMSYYLNSNCNAEPTLSLEQKQVIWCVVDRLQLPTVDQPPEPAKLPKEFAVGCEPNSAQNSQDPPSLQEVIADAPNGSTLTLCPGLFYEDILIHGMKLSIRGAGENLSILLPKSKAMQVEAADLSLSEVTLKGISSDNYGGALKIQRSKVELENILIEDGQSIGGGGGIYANDHTQLHLKNVDIKNCASLSFGGALMIYGTESSLTIEGGSFEDNKADTGGALSLQYTQNSSVIAAGFHRNEAKNGGAVSATLVQDGKFSNLFLTQNTAIRGAAFYFEFSDAQIAYSSFASNQAYESAMIDLANQSSVQIKNPTLFQQDPGHPPHVGILDPTDNTYHFYDFNPAQGEYSCGNTPMPQCK